MVDPEDAPQPPGHASIVMERRVQWSDTDASGQYHNSTVLLLAEAAETLLLSRLGILDDVYGRLPRVHVEVDFRRPLYFHDVVEVALRVEELRRTSIVYTFAVRRAEDCARGRMVAVLMDRTGGHPVPWPEEHRRLLKEAGPLPPERLTRG